MNSRVERYEKILKKHGVTLPKEKLLELIDSIDQLAECFLNFEKNFNEQKSGKMSRKSTSQNQYPDGSAMKFLRIEDILHIFSST